MFGCRIWYVGIEILEFLEFIFSVCEFSQFFYETREKEESRRKNIRPQINTSKVATSNPYGQSMPTERKAKQKKKTLSQK